jgi:hypothetical protein
LLARLTIDLAEFNFTNMFTVRCCSCGKEGGDYTQADADGNHDQESVAVDVDVSTEVGA